MRKKDDTLRDTLLALARKIADEDGLDAINIRFLAKKAGVATGTVYNYFTNKDEILLALTEEYWRQALLEVKTVVKAGSFCAQVQEIFTFLKERIDQSAGKLMSSLGNVETAGQARMVSMQSAFETVFVRCMEQDADIRGDIWDEGFTREQFARFIMMNMVLLLKSEAPDMDFLSGLYGAQSIEEKEVFMPLAVILSFGFYLPVVLFSGIAPAVGVLMIPKTLAYVWIVLMGWQLYRQSAEKKESLLRRSAL